MRAILHTSARWQRGRLGEPEVGHAEGHGTEETCASLRNYRQPAVARRAPPFGGYRAGDRVILRPYQLPVLLLCVPVRLSEYIIEDAAPTP